MKEKNRFISSEFYFELFNQLPDALVLLDSDLNIKLSNHLFRDLFHSNDEVNFEEVLGHKLGCKDFYQSVSGHDMKINCSNCKLKNSVKKAISNKRTQKPDTMVLQTKGTHDESLKLIQFQAIYIKYKNQEYVLLKLNDLTEFGNNTVDLIANPKKDY